MEVPTTMRFSGHVVAMPYPGRGHVTPMLRLCKLIAASSTSQGHDDGALLITIVVTQEWLGYIGSEPKPDNIRFATIPNVVPHRTQIAADFPAFFQAAITNIEAPFDNLLDQLQPPVTAIIGDVELQFPVAVARRRNIPVALLWTMSASFYYMLHQLESLARNRGFKVHLLDDDEEHIPGISSAQLSDLRTVLHENDMRFLQPEMKCISTVPKADCLILSTIQELEVEAIYSLKNVLPFPIYPISFPYFKPETGHSEVNNDDNLDYLNWLDSQPARSVLYISFGSFLSVSSAQMNEIVSALNTSGVGYFWVARGEASWLKEKCGDRGLVVPWCDQLKVLSHPSVGGFWSHCGWNSTTEAVFAGIPMLTFPLFFDQVPNRRKILEEWKNGWELKRSKLGSEELITQAEILEVVSKFMDLGSGNGKEIRDRALELKGICDRAVAEGGSSNMNLNAFIQDFLCFPRSLSGGGDLVP
ncbi:UDP-glycosyltransferase 87A1-like [Gastrolobium bilobum]|uniref:UDP-glycosyltransferase 87A1-like n=1 Tax=Gastrolobium bilobum TaxID=150636 RepID=UPI002AB27C6C|nr:UDP-glycosyltransferase 87A1-like [Gastrolobium bilobum]XP_061359944.1 UDP-glycosyltransferase 87A1-like [Gastrolobium bilobum]